ncbi:MAG: hypothetical protein HY292_23960 [Planctomycetes bacterium]|nr:hypothetical protein [Planctomycetota bacterium]
MLVLLFVVLLEPAFRLVYAIAGAPSDRLEDAAAFFLGKSLGGFEPSPYVGFRLVQGKDTLLRADGFVSTKEVTKARTEPTIRIAFIGASTTQGGNEKAYFGSFPYFVEEMLHRNNLPAEVLNCGVSAWTSAENLINYEMNIEDYAPDCVVIHQGANDCQTRLYKEFHSDYRHMRRAFALPQPGRFHRFLVEHSKFYTWFLLRTNGIPNNLLDLATQPLPPEKEWGLAPEGVAAFRRNTENLFRIAVGGGAHVLLTTESHNRRPKVGGEEASHGMRKSMDQYNNAVRDIAREQHVPLADTEVALDFHGEYFKDYVHVSVEGNQLKAQVIGRALLDAGLRSDPRYRPDPKDGDGVDH